ncbi:MAG: helix-turn-helix domain-containing protein [Kibdelosporangium sp.]
MVDILPPNPQAPLYRRFEAAIPAVVKRVLEAFFASSAAYRQLPHELVDKEITESVSHNLRVFLRSLCEQRPPEPDELADQIAVAIRRAQQGVPLEMVLSTYHLAGQVGLATMAELAGPEDMDALLPVFPALLRYLAVVVPAIAASYVREQQAMQPEHREARRALVSALLAGTHAETLAEDLGLALSHQHVVVSVRLGIPPHADDAADQRLPIRGIVRRMLAEMPSHALVTFKHNGGTVLLPASAETAEIDLAKAAKLVTQLHVAAGVAVIAGIATATSRADIPTAAHQAADIAELAERLGRPPGAYVLDDVLLEYQLCRPGPGRQRLASVLDSLSAHPELMRTLSAFIDSGHNRHEAAAALHVHRNTLNYRLRRIAALTGCNPADPTGSRLLAASLIVRDLLTPQ